jgi:hypothetical protein
MFRSDTTVLALQQNHINMHGLCNIIVLLFHRP